MATTTATGGSAEGAKVLTTLIQGMMSELGTELKDHVDNQVVNRLDQHYQEILRIIEQNQQEVIAAIGALRAAQLDNARSTAGTKRTTKTTPRVETAGAASADEVKFPNNKMIWTKHSYWNDPEFRAWITAEVKKFTPNIEEDMKADPNISKKNGDMQIKAEITYMWNLIRSGDGAAKILLDEIQKRFAEAKAQHELASQPAQQVADQHTPEQTPSETS